MRGAIVEGGVYFPKSNVARYPFRRVIAVLNGRVFYSTGGNKNRECSEANFKRAVKKEAAK